MKEVIREITADSVISHKAPIMVSYSKSILMSDNISGLELFAQPTRLRATTVFVCLSGEIDCSINLKNITVSSNQLLVNFVGDVIQTHRSENVTGYAIVFSEDYMQRLQLDFKLSAQSYVSLHHCGAIDVPYEELKMLKPYYELLKKNMEAGNADVIKGLVLALSYTIINLVNQYGLKSYSRDVNEVSRAQQLFDKFLKLLNEYHYTERSLSFYAGKMCLTPKYVSAMIRSYSGKSALDWINEYVVLESKMMLRYTQMTIKEIAYSLNFPTQSAFGKYFKQQVGFSPKNYRYL